MARSKSAIGAAQNMNILVAAAVMAFSTLTIIQVELMSPIISFVEGHPQLPATGSIACLLVLAIAGDTRDPADYHELEVGLIMFGVAFTLLMTFFEPIRDFVISNNPVTGTVVVLLLLVVGGLMGR